MEDNAIYIGDKPFMNYVTGVVMQFTTHEADTVTIRARGKHITRAVDVALIATKRFLQDLITVGNIAISSEEFINQDGKKIEVSVIEITLHRK